MTDFYIVLLTIGQIIIGAGLLLLLFASWFWFPWWGALLTDIIGIPLLARILYKEQQ